MKVSGTVGTSELADADLDILSRQYHILLKDYFRSDLGQRVRQALLAHRGMIHEMGDLGKRGWIAWLQPG
jgi:hypothetical protein